ncbi:LysR family transcriptional regulator [Mycobacterium nebraskense]|uniref:Probable hydrogen peroxide-inducible genes activator n=1 Tax=Mycobacterium nebraskense TaxID=244292 RepID=A0A0F5NAA7_9MYCO|nr:LysR family transcriptional regulator [Mycobacterium nebraskense]KKC03971.1 LysR family transcriptional regulator [Mycobacterium nebraskense]KLO43070.1 LysR family transcriptional regulator [Mycobacterium nebraskense]MBI2696906.1 LysR family transcriptional regulator [Mycobacterium nebraskense]MCV7117975.1 LysR family transcriptional regulator [Mycobacterium nebraskense]ORW19464.1 LysR family transcriptional regulator [Mycobacterium nebraskense]
MDTHRLKYFLRIAEEGSISRAAAVLGVAQPALSRQIRLLEEDLGIVLFHRTRRGVHLTEEGERLRSSTAAPLRQLELAVRYAGSPLARIERGLLFGMVPTAAGVLAAPLLATLSAAFPNVHFRVAVAETDELVQRMLKGAIDLAVINPVSDDRLFYRHLVVEDLVLVGGPTSDLSPTSPVCFSDLATLPLVMPSAATGIRNTLENTALRLKVGITARFSTDSLEVAKNLVEAGLGYTVLPPAACGADVDAGRLRCAPICEPEISHQLGVAATAALELPREFATKIGILLREEVARLTKSGFWAARFEPSHSWDPNFPEPQL